MGCIYGKRNLDGIIKEPLLGEPGSNMRSERSFHSTSHRGSDLGNIDRLQLNPLAVNLKPAQCFLSVVDEPFDPKTQRFL